MSEASALQKNRENRENRILRGRRLLERGWSSGTVSSTFDVQGGGLFNAAPNRPITALKMMTKTRRLRLN